MTTETKIRRLATVQEFCEFAGITLGHAAQLRYTGDGPEFVKITGRQVRYRWSDIEKWVESRIRSRTDDPHTPHDQPRTQTPPLTSSDGVTTHLGGTRSKPPPRRGSGPA